jgi:hypothetical protein
MTTYSDHQRRLLQNMLSAMSSYRQGKMPFSRMVGELEGALDAGDFKDEDMLKTWYDVWTDLETLNALSGDSVSLAEVSADLSKLESLVEGLLRDGGSEAP